MLVRVATYTNAIEAHLARGRLEAEGIPAFVCHEHHVWANWLRSLALGGVKVYVPLVHEHPARDIVAAHDQGQYALPDNDVRSCPRCNGTSVTRGRLSWKAALLTIHFASVPLYFHWATLRCGTCRHEWDLPNTRTYSVITLSLAAGISVGLFFALYVLATCWSSPLSSDFGICRFR